MAEPAAPPTVSDVHALPAYHDAALAVGTLGWEATPMRPRVARVFDGVHPEHGPYFRTDHELLADDRRELLLDYLRGADVILDIDGNLDDVLAAGTPRPISVRAATTGQPNAPLWRAG